MKFCVFALIVAAFVGFGSAQMVKQCKCSDVQPCKEAYVNSIIPCADSCQNHAAAVGANYQKLRGCLTAREGQIRAAMQCSESKMSNS
jgi:hypothetical protein